MKDASHGSPHEHVMHEICVHTVSERNSLAWWLRGIIREDLLNLATNGFQPIELPDWQVQVVRLRHSGADCFMPHLGAVATNLLDTAKVSLARCRSEGRQSD